MCSFAETYILKIGKYGIQINLTEIHTPIALCRCYLSIFINVLYEFGVWLLVEVI